MARCLLMLGHASGASHSLLGACPLDPLVLMFNPSFGTHLSSQLWYTSFMLWHSTRQCSAVLWCRGHAPCTATHLSSYGTALTEAWLCLGMPILPISIHIQIFTGLNTHAPSVSHSFPGRMYTLSIFNRSIGGH